MLNGVVHDNVASYQIAVSDVDGTTEGIIESGITQYVVVDVIS